MIVPEKDRMCGMEVYSTGTARCSCLIRSEPSDFLVVEIIDRDLLSRIKQLNTLPLFVIKKENFDTLGLERYLSSLLGCRVRFFGLKDKRSISFQYAAISSEPKKNIANMHKVGYVKADSLDSILVGNLFRIRLRNACSHIDIAVKEVREVVERSGIPNFFGIQRFGSKGIMNHIIGRLIIKRKFEEAAKLLSSGNGFYEREVRMRLQEGKGWISAIRSVPIRIRRLFTQAYQSYIFNRILSRALKNGLELNACSLGDFWFTTDMSGLKVTSMHGPRERPNREAKLLIQIPGYAYRETGSRFDRIIEEVMEEEGIEPRDFFVKELQEVSCEGGLRRAALFTSKLQLRQENGDYILSFILPRGQYATILLREIVKPEDKEIEMFA
jgi:tRNA pseudouridine13 synthase